MNRDDLYNMLGLNKLATADMVKKAFRDFAKNNHPDFFPGNPQKEERFKRVTAAYQKWKLIQTTVYEIKRIRTASQANGDFRPWAFSCWA